MCLYLAVKICSIVSTLKDVKLAFETNFYAYFLLTEISDT